MGWDVDEQQISEVLRVIATLEARIERLEAADTRSVPKQATERGVVYIPDGPYDHAMWHGADDEGVGGYQRH